MLRFQYLRRLLAVVATFVLLTISTTAQAPAGLDVDIDPSGISIYRMNADGSRSLVIFVPAVANAQSRSGWSSMSGDVMPFGHLVVNTSALNVRSGPGVQYTIITAVPGGTELGVVGQNDGRENWWYVEVPGGARGWINNIHVLIRGDLSGTPVVESAGTIIQPTLYIGYPGNPIYPTLPHQGAPACYLPGRSEFPIIGRSSQSSWYQINAVCQDGSAVVGWVEASLGIVRNPAGVEFPVTAD